MAAFVCYPKFRVTFPAENPDRLMYTPDRPWPSGGKRSYRVNFLPDNTTVVFDEDGRPSDLLIHMNMEARKKLQSRRQTPRSHALASEE